jgi:hypothetical protein
VPGDGLPARLEGTDSNAMESLKKLVQKLLQRWRRCGEAVIEVSNRQKNSLVA